MKPAEAKEQSPDIRRSMIPLMTHNKSINQKSNKMNFSTEFKKTVKNNKEQTSPRSGSGKYQSFTKFPPIKKGVDEIHDDIPKISQKQSQKEKDSQINQKQAFVVKQPIKKKPINRKTSIQSNNIMLNRFLTYKNFLSLINISNNVSITSQKLQIGNKYYAYFGKGNNSALVKNIIKCRPWWTITEDPEDPKINFVWTQLKQNDILEKIKQIKNDDYDDLTYQLKKGQKTAQNIEQQQLSKTTTMRNRTFTRSQSVINKQSLNYTIKTVKRNSSKPRQPTSNKMISSMVKDLKQGIQFQKERVENKKQLVNPKAWMNYQNLRKIFNQTDMKNLKNISAILEDGRVKPILRNGLKTYDSCSSFLIHNRQQNNWHLSNKKALFVNMKNYYEAKKINPFQYIPVTFHIQSLQSNQFKQFVEYYNSKSPLDTQNKKQIGIKTKSKRRNIWLVKPGQNSNRGTGIMVSESLDEIKQIISSDTIDCKGRPRTHILQEYILPFLYNKRKFDIRSYILLTSVNGVNKGYWFQQGYIRTACKQFNFKNLSNKYIHLTNDAVQKKCQDYGKFEPGNKISFSDFQRYLDTNQPKSKFWSQAYPEMKKLATDAIKAVYTKINPNKRQFSFQIFGLDFMIDQSFKVWLIQANTNPCLELSCPLLGRIIPSMLENAFRVAVDPIFPPPSESYILNLPRTFVPQNILQVNRFQLVFDEIQEGKYLKSILTNTPNMAIYNIEQQQQQYQEGDKNIENYKPDDQVELQ